MMKKTFLVFVMMTLVIGAVFFYDQVLAIFKGMTVLEAMKFIVTFVLHVAVTTICVYAVYTAPEIVKPWLKTLRMKRRMARRGHAAQPIQKQKSPRMSTDMLLRAYMLQQMAPKAGRSVSQSAPTPHDDIHIEF